MFCCTGNVPANVVVPAGRRMLTLPCFSMMTARPSAKTAMSVGCPNPLAYTVKSKVVAGSPAASVAAIDGDPHPQAAAEPVQASSAPRLRREK
jgi:hypothetical protein